MIAFGTAIMIFLQLVGMDHLFALGAFDPPTKSIFFGGLDFNLGLMPRKKS